MIPIANPQVSASAQQAVSEVLESGMLADGDLVREFEGAFAEYVGVDHAVATSSGTASLHAILEAAGVRGGDAVLTPAFSFIASANAAVHAGARPVFADVERETGNVSVEEVRAQLRQRDDIAAILPVHLYGLPANTQELQELAREYDVLLVEDAAQAHGATVEGTHAGALGDAAAFSFYPTKNMTTGEGGMVTTDDPELARRVRQVINHGRTDKYEHEFVGYNYRMTNIQAAIGLDQLERLPGWVAQRRENARTLAARLEEVPGVTPPATPFGRTHAYHQFTVRTPHRPAIRDAFDRANVGYGIYYPTPIPDQPAYDRNVDVPVARELSQHVLSLPIHPGVGDSDLESIANTVETVVRSSV
jgi:dTDP-4-amino-4,6-dideoxygalactose transaminase